MSKNKLVAIAKRMKGQDNRITANPIFLVQQQRRVYGIMRGRTDNFVWLHNGREYTDEEKDKYIEECEPGGEGWEHVGYIDEWVFVQPFFSNKGAEAYVASNRHNLNNPRVYVDSAYRNKEWQAVREVLIDLAGDDENGTEW